ncbi:MAG: GNAT family N-acetyltransferase [Chloroflexi bacterium]|nr:MAG: GNAT family N-acetyltransferase [Chloroflexota bacterium]
MDSLELRAVSAEDDDFLCRVYAASRADEMSLVAWDEAAKQSFLQMQFAAQQAHYRAYFSKASHDVILAEGAPVGRLYVDQRETEIRILDIGLLPERRGHGIGSRVLQDLMEEAKAANKTLSIYVEDSNPSLRLFQRLGFVKAGENDISYLMEWHPSGK